MSIVFIYFAMKTKHRWCRQFSVLKYTIFKHNTMKNTFPFTLFALLITFSSCKSGQSSSPSATENNDNMVLIPAGTLNMGGDNEQADPNEYPKHPVLIEAFYMDATEVTNAQFSDFVQATGYQTVAERAIDCPDRMTVSCNRELWYLPKQQDLLR